MKKALILGTSHSYGFIIRDNVEIKMTEGRWHDYLKTEYDMEVTNISQPGVTPSGMLAGLLLYLSENPNERWDLAIVEGRHMEQHFDVLVRHNPREAQMPIAPEKEYIMNLPGWRFSGVLGTKGFLPAGSYSWQRSMTKYSTHFMGSPLQAIQNYGLNRSICSILETVSNKVVWTSWNSWVNEDYWDTTEKWLEQLLGEWMRIRDLIDKFEETFPISERDEYLSECGHFNEKGHKWVWTTMYKPMIEKLLTEADII